MPPNRPEDFPPALFALVGYCRACRHWAAIDRAAIPPGLSIPELGPRLHCQACGARGGEVRIVYSGAGGFRYGAAGAGGRGTDFP